MKRLLPLIALLFSTSLIGQPFGNEWIDYSQKYYKFKIAENGVYRISYQSLLNSSIPVASLNPQNLQLFARGSEVPLYINGEADGSFDSGDYIEFYGEKNDGWLDTALYDGKANQPNPFYSLINDTISYYLTWNNSTNNLRYQEENAIDFGNYFVADYLWKENLQVYRANYYDGQILSSKATNPEYTESEGWMDGPLNLGSFKNKGISTPNRYASGPFVDFEIQVVGASNPASVNNGDHHLRITFGSQTVDEIFEGYELVKVQRNFSPTELNKGVNNIRFESIDDRNVPVDRTALAYMRIIYPHTLNLDNSSYFEFQLDDAGIQNGQYLELILFQGGSSPILYDLTNRKKVRIVQTLSNYKTIVPNGSGRKECVILAESEVKNISLLSPVEGSGSFTDLDAGITDSAFVIITHNSLISEASRYAAYRQTQGFPIVLVTIDQLYDQYAFGIEKHPLAIRNFMHNALVNWVEPPSHLFLIGKSITAKSHRNPLNNSTNAALAFSQNLVPSLGNPSADNLLISGLQGTNLETPIPLGRLSANNNAEVGLYLDKVIEYESAPYEKWMKRALHFAGGKTNFETNTHESYLNNYAQDFESFFYGGKAFLFQKSSSAPYQVTLADSIRGLINNGVSLMTFFGHSGSTGGFDISIDSPDRLQNKGKYPLLIGNSCFAGNYHQYNVRSTSEEYVIQKDAGVIGFIANGNLGVGFYLNQYSNALYENLTKKHYGKSIAESMRQAVKDVQSANTEELLKNVCIEMSLQGDPALVINAPSQVDYSIEKENVSVSPKEVTTDLSSFKVNVRVDNIGLAITDSVLIRFVRDFPQAGKEDSSILIKVPPIYFEQNLEFNLPIDLLTDVGENKFTVLIDPFNEVQELNESNNRVEFSVLVRSGEIIPVYPYDFSIVGKQSTSLSASTAFAFEEEETYLFELDTTIKFNSSSKATTSVVSSGGVVEWQPNLLQNMQDSAVYYWRVSKQPQAGEPFNWKQRSFQYIPNEQGFAQDHFEQYNKNSYRFLTQNPLDRSFQFTDQVSELSVFTQGSPSITETNNVKYAIDADTREKSSCYASPSFLIAILDSASLESWETPFNGLNTQNDFGQANVAGWCIPDRNRAEKVFSFQSRDTMQMIAMRNFLNNPIIQGHYIVVYNWLNIDYAGVNGMDSSILKAFESLGATALKNLPNGYPIIITAKVGEPNSVQEIAGTSTNDEISLRRTLTTSADFGEMTSIILGPSKDFERLQYEFKSQEVNSKDSVAVELIGYDSLSKPSVIFTSKALSLDTVITNVINENTYDRLQLKLTAQDEQNQTPPQLERWQVSYVELPDLALSPNIFFTTNKDTLQQGENFELEVAVKNVSQTQMDSVEIAYSVLKNRNEIELISVETYPKLEGDSVLMARASVPTAGFFGENTLLIEVNPQRKQSEQFYFNNVGQYVFFTESDRINPLLDVTFDGRHILNREIISPEPTIVINLEDDNEFLAIDDTSSFAIYLRYPNGNEELINFGSTVGDIQFIPASLPKNRASIIFRPSLTEDGVYQLRVQAKDKSGNASGNKDFRIEFEIVTKSTVTHLLNYPNPFSTSTRFVFTLTGKQVPDQIQIQIMTISGKIVREIDENELGPVYIGNNITEFAWDGKDEFGDQLANGVYLYRVKMKINGNNIERRESSADKAFIKEFGKMYLIR